MKVKILAALKTKFIGVQDAILNRVADKLVSSGKGPKEEDIATAVDGVTFQQVLEMYGDSRANEASTTAVRNYETTHKLKDGKPTEGAGAGATATTQGGSESETTQGGSESETIPAWAQAIIDGNKAVLTRVDALEKGRTTESRRSQLDAVIAKLPEAMRKAYSRTPVETQTDDEFNTLLADITNEVAAIETSTRSSGAVTGRPLGAGRTAAGAGLGGSNVEASDAEVDAVVAKLNI